MITEKDLPDIRRMARSIVLHATFARSARRNKTNQPRLKQVCTRILRLCDKHPPPLTSIEQLMSEAIQHWKRMKTTGA